MDGLQNGPDAGMHFRNQAHCERGGFCLPAEPSFQLSDSLLVRPFLRPENGRCPGGTGKGNVRIVEGMDPDAVGKGSQGLEKTGAAVHDRCSAQANPNFLYALMNSILHQFTCTDG